MSARRSNCSRLQFVVAFYAMILMVWLPGCRTKTDAHQMYLETRIDVARENITNANTVVDDMGQNNPYRRRVVCWHVDTQTFSISEDPSPFKLRYDPIHPLADSKGYVMYPNIDRISEELELRIAQRDLLESQSSRN